MESLDSVTLSESEMRELYVLLTEYYSGFDSLWDNCLEVNT